MGHPREAVQLREAPRPGEAHRPRAAGSPARAGRWVAAARGRPTARNPGRRTEVQQVLPGDLRRADGPELRQEVRSAQAREAPAELPRAMIRVRSGRPAARAAEPERRPEARPAPAGAPRRAALRARPGPQGLEQELVRVAPARVRAAGRPGARASAAAREEPREGLREVRPALGRRAPVRGAARVRSSRAAVQAGAAGPARVALPASPRAAGRQRRHRRRRADRLARLRAVRRPAHRAGPDVRVGARPRQARPALPRTARRPAASSQPGAFASGVSAGSCRRGGASVSRSSASVCVRLTEPIAARLVPQATRPHMASARRRPSPPAARSIRQAPR